jgi:hypothetical protein
MVSVVLCCDLLVQQKRSVKVHRRTCRLMAEYCQLILCIIFYGCQPSLILVVVIEMEVFSVFLWFFSGYIQVL